MIVSQSDAFHKQVRFINFFVISHNQKTYFQPIVLSGMTVKRSPDATALAMPPISSTCRMMSIPAS